MPANAPTQLPAYIALRYQENGVFSKLQSDVANVTGVIRRDFEEMSGTIEASLSRALTAQRNGFGSLDLGVGKMREAIRLQEMLASAAEETARAARRASEAEGGQSVELRRAAEAAEALAAKERDAAAAAQVHADVIAKVQAELDREVSATTAVVAANRRLAAANDNSAKSAGTHRMAMVGLGQQLQDAVIQAQMGTNALTIFAQQGSQAAFQMAGMGGAVGRVASVMAGPWGAAIFAGTALLGPLIAGLFQTSDAMDEVKFSSNAMKDAQGILGDVVDLTTGKITTQRSELIALARAQLIVARLQSQQREAVARGTITESTQPQWYIGGGPVGVDIGRRTGIQAQVGRDFAAGRINTDDAVRQLELLRKEGRITTEQFTDLAQAYANLGVEIANQKVYQEGLDLLDGKGGKALLKPEKPKKPKADHSAERAAREAERLKEFGDKAEESIARINERFDEQPRLIDQAARATRELDDLIQDLGKRKPIGFEKTIADAEAAKRAVQDALVRPLDDARKASEQRLAVQELLAQGRDDEAAGLQAVFALEEKLGDEEVLRARVQDLIAAGRKNEADALQYLLDKYPEMKRQAAAIAEIEAQRTREADRQRALFEAQINVLQTARNDLTAILSGRKADLFGDIKQALKDLQGARLADSLFGGVFRQIEDELRQRSPLGQATTRLVAGVDTATGGVDKLATATETAADRILAAANKIAANDNGYIDATTGDIVVTRNKPDPVELKRLSIVQLADLSGHAIADPILAGLDQLLGTRFFQNMSGTVSGVIGGSLVAGKVGGVLGGLRGLTFDYGPDLFGKGMTEKLLGKFDAGLGGAATGSQIAGIANALGIKMSNTGAQIGGAIGAMIPVPGLDIVGAIAGGLLGGLFKKKPHGTAVLTSAYDDAAIYGNKGSARDAAGSLAGSVQEGLRNIADSLGADLGGFNVSIGTYKDKYRVGINGGSGKLGGYSGSASQNEQRYGLYDFGSDSEAAIKFAISDAIKDGALLGLRKSTQALLQGGTDLDAQLQKAKDWEGAFRELRSYTDPLGAALDDLDSQFQHLIDIADEAGASTQELADLQQLYSIKQAEIIKQQQERVIGSLQGLLDDLTIGDSGLSLRTREANALAKYQPLAARVAAGDTTAYDDYAKAAQDLLGIERELYGSQQQYFDRLGEITDLTRTRIDAETNVVSIAENRNSPFDSAGQVNASINNQTDVLGGKLDAMITNQATLIRALLQNGWFGSLPNLNTQQIANF